MAYVLKTYWCFLTSHKFKSCTILKKYLLAYSLMDRIIDFGSIYIGSNPIKQKLIGEYSLMVRIIVCDTNDKGSNPFIRLKSL